MADRISRVLVVDDEEGMRTILTHMLEKEGFKVITAEDGEQAMRNICFDALDAVLLDVYLPRLSGMEVLKKIREVDDGLPVVLISGHADIHQAVEAVKEGAYDYLAKPFDNNEVVCITRRAIAERQLGRDLTSTNDRYCGNFGLIESMGPSNKIARLLADVHGVARSDFSVVIVGETGSGKELVARAIHQDSARAEAPFVPMDCGAIPEPLLESELFGHEKGSFTGADRQTRGKFEQAEGGTLFMDEITNLPLASQAKFLRVIQDRKLYRIGSLKPLDVHIRLIVAANRDLQEMAAVDTFRKDLYYRLSEFTIYVPSLRERKEDIPYLAKRFLDMADVELNKMITGFSDGAVDALMTYDWPGNVRQLRSVIRRATLVARDVVTEKDLDIRRAPAPAAAFSLNTEGMPWKHASLKEIIQQHVLAVEMEVLSEAMRFTGGNKARMARLLQVDYKTIHTKVKKLGIPFNGGHDD